MLKQKDQDKYRLEARKEQKPQRKLLWLWILIGIVSVILGTLLTLKFTGWFDSISMSYVESGDAFLEEKMYSKAMKDYEFAIALRELDGEGAYLALIRKAEIYDLKGDNEKALELLEKATKTRKKKTEAWIALGNLQLKMDMYEDARQSFEKASEVNGEDPLALVGLARAMVGLDASVQETKQKLVLAEEYGSDLQLTNYYLGLIHLRNGDNLESAAKRLKKAGTLKGLKNEQVQIANNKLSSIPEVEENESDSDKAFRALKTAWLFIALNELELAEAEAKSAMELHENYQDAQLAAAYIALLQKDHEKSLELIETIEAKDPINGFAFYIEGENYLDLEKYEEAQGALDKAIEYDYETADSYEARGDIKLALGKDSEASRAYEQAFNLNESRIDVAEKLIWLLDELGRFEKLDEVSKKLVEANPTDARAVALRAFAHSSLEKLDKARSTAEQALEIDKSEALAHYVLGKVADIDGDDALKDEMYDLAREFDLDGKVSELVPSN